MVTTFQWEPVPVPPGHYVLQSLDRQTEVLISLESGPDPDDLKFVAYCLPVFAHRFRMFVFSYNN